MMLHLVCAMLHITHHVFVKNLGGLLTYSVQGADTMSMQR
jgi:hypothetical protein